MDTRDKDDCRLGIKAVSGLDAQDKDDWRLGIKAQTIGQLTDNNYW